MAALCQTEQTEGALLRPVMQSNDKAHLSGMTQL